MGTRTPLTPTAPTVYELGADLLLVFKPRGYVATEHAHPHAQRLRVLRGCLRVVSTRREGRVEASAPYVLEAGELHSTEALADTWLVAENLPD